MSGETSENRWEQRLSPLIVKGGVLPAPSVLLRHAGELNLTPQELVLCLYILDKKWGPDWPYVSMLQAADELGRHKNKVYAWKKSLVEKGYLVATPRTVPGIGRRADYCDLSGLFAALERLVLAEAVQQARGDLPTPLYDVSQFSTLSTGRSTLFGAARCTEKGAPRRTKNGAPRSTAGGAARGTRSGARNRKPPEEPGPGEIAHPETARQRSDTTSGGAPRPTEDGPESDELAARIEQHGVEFRDDDPARSRVRAHRAWWNSGLPRGRFLALVELARTKTREQISKSGVRSGPPGQRRAMAYFFAVLEDLARDEADRLRGAG
ncbi:MAG: helix-turn-helix domain-containing protein [Chloroflexota bacterium]|nr:helix-turn-helix domain-containing protein [Chloroflexota bacterium]